MSDSSTFRMLPWNLWLVCPARNSHYSLRHHSLSSVTPCRSHRPCSIDNYPTPPGQLKFSSSEAQPVYYPVYQSSYQYLPPHNGLVAHPCHCGLISHPGPTLRFQVPTQPGRPYPLLTPLTSDTTGHGWRQQLPSAGARFTLPAGGTAVLSPPGRYPLFPYRVHIHMGPPHHPWYAVVSPHSDPQVGAVLTTVPLSHRTPGISTRTPSDFQMLKTVLGALPPFRPLTTPHIPDSTPSGLSVGHRCGSNINLAAALLLRFFRPPGPLFGLSADAPPRTFGSVYYQIRG
eukprot:190722-Hanusia_phi.AAC.1